MSSPTNAAIQHEHARNEARLEALAGEVERVAPSTTTTTTATATANGKESSSNSSSRASPSAINSNDKRSPVNIASQLFSRNKSKPKKSGKKTPPAQQQQQQQRPPNATTDSGIQRSNLAAEIKDTQQREAGLVSAAIGISPDGRDAGLAATTSTSSANGVDGGDEVLDLADQLLAQLDARDNAASPSGSGQVSVLPDEPSPAGQARGHPNTTADASPQPIPIPAQGTASSNVPLAAPQPTHPAPAPAMSGSANLRQAPSRESALSNTSGSTSNAVPPVQATGSRPQRRSSDASGATGASSRTSFGAKLKQALSPNSNAHNTGSSTSLATSASASANSQQAQSIQSATTSGDGSSYGQIFNRERRPSSGNGGGGGSSSSPSIFKNRHALRKEKKKAQEDALRAEAQAEVEAERAAAAGDGTISRYDAADLEKRGIDQICRTWNLELYEIEPDGHCMYSAVADQLVAKRVDKKANYETVRKAAAEYMRGHMDDFLPFMPAEDVEGEDEGLLSPEGYLKHCDNVEKTAEWGSQTELLALSQALQVPIWVIQSRSPIVKIGSDQPYAKKKTPLIISYHRVQYGLGSHYNSLRPIPRDTGMIYLG